MIIIKNLIKKYNNLEVIKSINLIIQDKEKIAIMGLNGSGKTTLSEIIIGVKKQTKGEIIYSETKVTKNAVFQESSYDAEMPIYEIAKFYYQIFNSTRNLDELFEKFELVQHKKMKFRKLSGGQKQKFKFLIAIINNPKVLLLDELTTSLDYLWKNKIINLIKKEIENNDSTVILISHDINEIAKLCNRVILLSDGIIIKDINLFKKEEEKKLEILKKLINSY